MRVARAPSSRRRPEGRANSRVITSVGGALLWVACLPVILLSRFGLLALGFYPLKRVRMGISHPETHLWTWSSLLHKRLRLGFGTLFLPSFEERSPRDTVAASGLGCLSHTRTIEERVGRGPNRASHTPCGAAPDHYQEQNLQWERLAFVPIARFVRRRTLRRLPD